MTFLPWLLILLSGVFDRLRGMGCCVLGHGWAFVQGLVIAWMIHLSLPLTFAFALLWWLGASPGWGEPLGAYWLDRKQDPNNKEWWQFGSLSKPGNEALAVIVRGLIWGIPLLPLGYFDTHVISMLSVTTFSFILSPMLLRRYRNVILPIIKVDMWAAMEFVRGVMMAIGAYTIGVL